MAEKNDNDSHFRGKDSNLQERTDGANSDDEMLANSAAYQPNEVPALDDNLPNSLELGARREENPFSFKRFLNQDPSQKLQNLRRKNYSTEVPCSETSPEKQNFNVIALDNNTKVLNNTEMASVLPDFVQDHLVVEQCYLNGSCSPINIDNLNLHNLPDLNVEHRLVGFSVNNNGPRCDSNQHSLGAGINNLPDFTVNISDSASRTIERDNEFYLNNGRENTTRKRVQRNNESLENNVSRNNIRMSSSPSVPLDLPSYDVIEPTASGSLDQPIPFDLTVAAEDRNGSYRGMPATESVSKSLPDFLSDGPIQNDRLGENLQLGDLVSPMLDNNDDRISSEVGSDRLDRNRILRELETMRRQVIEKNRRIHMLESEIEDLRSRERRNHRGIEYAIYLKTERDLKQALERAADAENTLVKLRLENNRLRSKLASSVGGHSSVKSDETVDGSTGCYKSKKIAKELRIAANAAENSLRSLLTGIDNLRMIAASVENMQNYSEKTDELEDYNNEDSASGPAL